MIVEFVHYTDYINGATLESVDIFLESWEDSGRGIIGDEYYSQEAQQVSFSGRATTWLIANLFNSGITVGNRIGETEFWENAVRVKDDNENIIFVGFVRWETIEWHPMTQVYKITATDIVGLISNVAKDRYYTREAGQENYNTFLTTMLLKLLDSEIAEDFPLNMSFDYDYVGFGLEDSYEIINEQIQNFTDNNGEGVFGDSYDSFDPYASNEGGISWVQMVNNGDFIEVRLFLLKWWNVPYKNRYERVKRLIFKLNQDMQPYDMDFINYIFNFSYSPGQYSSPYYAYWLIDYPAESILTMDLVIGNNTSTFAWDFGLTGTGHVQFNQVKFKEDEDDEGTPTGEITEKYINFIYLMLLNNLAMYPDNTGFVTVVNKASYVTDTVQISEEDCLFDKEEYPIIRGILRETPNFADKTSVLQNSDNIARLLEAYYKTLFESLKDEHTLRVKASTGVQVCNRLNTFYALNILRVVRITNDLRNNYIDVIAYNEV